MHDIYRVKQKLEDAKLALESKPGQSDAWDEVYSALSLVDNIIDLGMYSQPKYENNIPLWNAGYVKYIDHLGDDLRPLVSARMSTLNPTGVNQKKDDGLRDYLWRHRHTSVFEQIELVVEVQVPIFIARQIIRHRTFQLNEFSMRYSEPLHLYYVPEPDYVCIEHDSNKQGSGTEADWQSVQDFINDARTDAILNRARYEKHRRRGIAKERVRDFQPVSAYTRIMIKANLRNWFHFLSLRLKPNAQREIRDMASAVYEIVRDLFPLCADLFEEWTLHAETFGRTEMEVLRDYIQSSYHCNENRRGVANFLGWLQNDNRLEGSRLKEFISKVTK